MIQIMITVTVAIVAAGAAYLFSCHRFYNELLKIYEYVDRQNEIWGKPKIKMIQRYPTVNDLNHGIANMLGTGYQLECFQHTDSPNGSWYIAQFEFVGRPRKDDDV